MRRFRSMEEARRLELLESELVRLRELAAGSAVVVEGVKDVRALEALGVGGTHVVIHRGVSLQAFVDLLVERALGAGWPRVVLLPDWDRTGGQLFRRLKKGLEHRITLETESRRRIQRLVPVKAVEELPAELAMLRRRQRRP